MQLEDIRKLSDLARIEMSDEEMSMIAKDFGSILAYVGQVQEVSNLSDEKSMDKKPDDYFLHNILREDEVTNNRGEYAKKIMDEMPETQDGFLKVRQIL